MPLVDRLVLWTASWRRSRGRLAGLPGRAGFDWVLGLLGAGLLALALMFTAVDPFDLYPWGARIRLTPDRYGHQAKPWLINPTTRGDFDTLLIGGSTAEQFTDHDMEALLSGVDHASSLVYPGARPHDLLVVLARVEKAPNLRRVILSYDQSWIYPVDLPRRAFPYKLYDNNPTNDLDQASPTALRLSFNILTRGTAFVPAWDRAPSEAYRQKAYDARQTPAIAESRRRMIEEGRETIDEPTTLTCADFTAIGKLADFARAMRRRNVRLDIVIPPYSYLAYYDYSRPTRRYRMFNEPALAMILQNRRCMIRALAAYPEVNIYGFDLEADIVEDLALYRDGPHLQGTGAGIRMLKAIDRDENRLTAASFEPYSEELRRRVKRYHYYSSGRRP